MNTTNTPDHSKPTICNTCDSACHIKGYKESEELIYCSWLRKILPFPVYQCSQYELKNTLDLHEMNQMAYLITNKKGVIGFIKPRSERDSNY